MNALLIPLGTPGDIQTFIELGVALLRRGHHVTLLAHAGHRAWIERYGLRFVELGRAEEYEALLADRNLWNLHKAPRVFAKKLVLPTLPRMYQAIEREVSMSPTVVVAQTMALGARVANEKLGVPLITVHRQPALLRSLHESPLLPYLPMGARTPLLIRRLSYRLIDASLDHRYASAVNAFRSTLGLKPVTRVVSQWAESPTLSLCLWPEWFAPTQPDWRPTTRLVGFDVQTLGEREPAGSLLQFLASGDKPVLFTLGSGMRHGVAFYEQSVQACAAMGKRALLVTRAADQVPSSLPAGMMHVEYAPFNWLLPRCAAVVHHAGIGTCAQALAAGVPQVCVPGIVFDTKDNANRLQRLGVARSVPVARYAARRVVRELSALLSDQQVKQRCAELTTLVQQQSAMELACSDIESIQAASSAGSFA